MLHCGIDHANVLHGCLVEVLYPHKMRMHGRGRGGEGREAERWVSKRHVSLSAKVTS